MHIASRETTTPSQLAAEVGVTMPTMRDQLQGLVDRGLVERVPNPLDGRSYFVVLTTEGRSDLKRGLAASKRAQKLVATEHGPLEPLRAGLLAFVRSANRVTERLEEGEAAELVERALDSTPRRGRAGG
jgi:DNA-binding MarR family transcriptional regulator